MNRIDAFLSGQPITLSGQQKAALARTSGQTLLLAVPGSGKTTVIIYRLGYLLAQGVDPDSVLTMTFSRAGARDLGERFTSIFKDAACTPAFSTIHSFSLSVIRRYEKCYHAHAFDVLSDGAAVLRRLYYQKYRSAISENDMSALQSAISLAKNRMASRKAASETKVAGMDFPALFSAYEEYKKAHRLMDYDDMLLYAYRLLKKYPDLLSYYRSRYQYINVDELQDTSPVQFAIIYLLTGKGGNLFMVGDEDQSIYGFRGAYPREMLMFKKRYPHGEVLFMTKNYRSTEAIVEAADAFVRHNTERYDKHMMTDNGPGEKVNLIKAAGKDAVYREVLHAAEKDEGKTAVLFRNNESALPLVDLFDRQNIDFVIREHSPLFFTHFAVRDVLSFMQLAQNPADADAFSEIYYKMDLAISKEQMRQVSRKADGASVFDILLSFDGLSEWQRDKIAARARQFKRLKKMNPGRAIAYISDAMGYSEHLAFREKQGYRIEGIEGKLEILKVIGARCENAADFARRLDELKAIISHPARDKKARSAITLSTVHGSKGLEFDHVLLIDCVEGIFPPADAAEDTPESRKLLNEEIRLFYVGVTRAKSRLTFVCDDSPGAPAVSRFIRAYFNPDESEAIMAGKKKEKIVEKVKRLKQNFQANKKQKPKESRKKRRPRKKAHGLKPGMRVCHKSFGEGVVLGVEEEKGVIRFDDGTSRLLNLSFSMATGILRPLKKR